MPPDPRAKRSADIAPPAGTTPGARLTDSSQATTGPSAVIGSAGADPDWWQTGVVYQIYPRSFADSSGDGIGDLRGIADHLDHLNAEGEDEPGLGAEAIWLSPIYPSPDFDFGYDVSDYLGVDPRFGSIEDFERLVEASHRRGLRVILDLVLNHSSSRHPWFEASRASRDGPYADWYIWRDSPGRTAFGGRRPPNNWRSYFGGPAWTWDESRGQFYLHTFLPEQPDFNWRQPALRNALLDVVRTWLDRGVDGFRLDVFNVYFKDATFRSNPRRLGGRAAWTWQRHVHDRNQPEMASLLAELRGVIDERPGRMTIGELFDGTIREAAGYIAPRHLIFDWSFMSLPWRASSFRAAIERRDAAFGPDRWPTNVLSNHDQPRHASRFGDGVPTQLGDARAKVAAALTLTLRGTPFLYYGEELALRNLEIPNERAFDPPARRSSFLSPWWNRDQARGPMPWRPGPGAGFTSGKPWLPLPADADTRNVESQSADSESPLAFYRRLLSLRRATPALMRGDQRLLDVGDVDVLAYVRESAEGSALVALNFGITPVTIEVPPAPSGASWRPSLSSHARPDREIIRSGLTLTPVEALVAVDC